MTEAVLDTSAVLAFIFSEPGAATVAAALPRALVSAINFAEIVTKLVDRGSDLARVQALITELPIEVSPASKSSGLAAGLLQAQTRSRGLSLGDRFCLALAQETGLPVLTADRAWAELGLDLDIRLIR
jgi:PIN domain nuclease of toxin-antitoxin system